MKWLGLFFRWLSFFLGIGFFALSCVLLKLDLGRLGFSVLVFSGVLITWGVMPLFRERL